MVLNGTWARYRIKEETANRILASAAQLGYNVNMKARGLRLSRSGLAGMILPHYRNRFFAGLAEYPTRSGGRNERDGDAHLAAGGVAVHRRRAQSHAS
jgi:hypothetical protein